LKTLGAQIEIVETARHGEAMQAAADAAQGRRFDAIVAAGGDGTVHDVAEGMVGHTTPLGIIPLGTANVFAREIGLDFSPKALAETFVSGIVRSIPVGEVNRRPFLFVVGVGFDAKAVRAFEAGGTRRLGQAGLAWPVLQALVSGRDPAVRVRGDRGESEASWVIVTRAKRYAGGLLLASQASVEEAGLYVVRFAGAGPLVRLRQLSALAAGLVRYDPGITVEPARRLSIEGDPAIPVQIDGELIGQLPLEIGLHSERLPLIVPER
jgi:diacylglycerol kinase (ATP)